MGDTKVKPVNVLWFDNKVWDRAKVDPSEIPDEARQFRDDGEWIYLLIRTMDEGKASYEPFPMRPVDTKVTDVTTSDLYASDEFQDYADVLKSDAPPEMNLQKGLVIAFVGFALLFTFLIVISLVGGPGGST